MGSLLEPSCTFFSALSEHADLTSERLGGQSHRAPFMTLGCAGCLCVHVSACSSVVGLCVVNINMSPCRCWGLFLCAYVSALLSVSPVCLSVAVVVVAVWAGKSLCVSKPWGWRAEQLQVATGKSKQARVGGCAVWKALDESK